MTDTPKCELCGEPMPKGEEVFKYHGYSGPCPKPALPKPADTPLSPERVEALLGMCGGSLIAQRVGDNNVVIPVPMGELRALCLAYQAREQEREDMKILYDCMVVEKNERIDALVSDLATLKARVSQALEMMATDKGCMVGCGCKKDPAAILRGDK